MHRSEITRFKNTRLLMQRLTNAIHRQYEVNQGTARKEIFVCVVGKIKYIKR